MREVVFKGSTRPAMVLGVPIVPFVVVAGGSALVAMWVGVLVSRWIAAGVAVLALTALGWCRRTSHRDDQRLHQHLLALRLHARQHNVRLWQGRSYCPVLYRGVHDDPAR